MKHICFKVGKYVSPHVKVPADLKGVFYTKWVGPVSLFRKKKQPKVLFSVDCGESFMFRLIVSNKTWHAEEITIPDGKNPVPIILSNGHGMVFFYHINGKVTEVVGQLSKLNSANEHRIECTIDDDDECYRCLGRAQKIVTDVDDGTRIYTWSSEMYRHSYSSEYEWHPSSQTVKALVSTRTLDKKRKNSFGDKDECINGHRVLPIVFGQSKCIYLRFDNHKYNIPRSIVFSFTSDDFDETSGQITKDVIKSDLTATIYYNNDTTLSIYAVVLVAPNYVKDLEFKKESRYNTN